MKRYGMVLFSMIILLLILFFVIQRLQIPILSNPKPILEQGGPLAAAISVGLLTSDVLVPLPSSLVMVTNGAVFGLFYGTILSLLGGIGSAILGFALGRRGSPLLSRYITAEEHSRAEALLSRWGLVAIIVTRPIPILAESVVILAGTSSIGWCQMILASSIGLLPIALLYAATGAFAASIGNGMIAFALSIVMAGVFWWATHYLNPHH